MSAEREAEDGRKMEPVRKAKRKAERWLPIIGKIRMDCGPRSIHLQGA